ncbi:hypothetical protein LUX57_53145 [Actinomadura madurae]|uniref:hypothetical protein n=1 Tax=Actinomadura madurae TaxID=1993 RepID=UPI0020D1F896|nr:hypothetical protein [Actinomadura madurae]MCP9972752.1 hypothetical protein [Actinomadura madurae]
MNGVKIASNVPSASPSTRAVAATRALPGSGRGPTRSLPVSPGRQGPDPPLDGGQVDALGPQQRPRPGVAGVGPAGEADRRARELPRRGERAVPADQHAALPEAAHQEDRQADEAVVAARRGRGRTG